MRETRNGSLDNVVSHETSAGRTPGDTKAETHTADSPQSLLLVKGRATAPALPRRAGASRTADLVPAMDELHKRARVARVRAVHRYDVGACELPIGGSSSAVAVAMRHEEQRRPDLRGTAPRRLRKRRP